MNLDGIDAAPPMRKSLYHGHAEEDDDDDDDGDCAIDDGDSRYVTHESRNKNEAESTTDLRTDDDDGEQL
jgi:hypothetical protein